MWNSGGRGFASPGGAGGAGPNGRRAQMDQQRQVIEQRKQQYLAQKAQAQKLNENGAAARSASLNAFSNDGSFLDKFKKLSETKTTNCKTKPSTGKGNIVAKFKNAQSSKPGAADDAKKPERRDRSRSRSRERKFDRRNRDNRGGRKRSYSPCTPVVEDMPHRKPSRFANILPSRPSNFLAPKFPASNLNSNIRINVQTKPPTPPLPPMPPDTPYLNIPIPDAVYENTLNVPLHAIPEPKPLDTVSIPPPKPLDAITIPPPKPMNLQAIPPPRPICLTQIPKPKELDLCSIPRPPPPDDVLLTDDDGSLSATLEATAKQVARNGDAWELTLKSQDNLWFLQNEHSSEFKQYRSLVLRYRNDFNKSNNDSASSDEKYEPEFSLREDSSSDEAPEGDVPLSNKNKCVNSSSDQDKQNKDKIKKRKSRWGDAQQGMNNNVENPGIVPVVSPTGLSPAAPPLTRITRQDPGLLQYAMKTYGNTNLTDEDWKKCEDHYKISILYQEMLQKRNEIEKLKAAGKFKYEYDSDEEIDEHGTWEHRLREQEMEATQRWASELTRQASGKHHIGDFLPPDELKKFMDKYSSVKDGKEPDLSDYKEFKLKEDNIGFKMLQKLGWSEGEGLGAGGSGIVDPVSKGSQRDSNQGLGADRIDNIEEGDDEFEAYRKRMMLAYRFRPNPLNNPRRPYY